MGRFFVVLGIILMVVGFLGPMFSLGGIFNGIEPMLNLATDDDAKEAELCEEGETLESETGASTYTQGVGYGSSIQYYCVDSDGTRRDVTGDFVNSLFGGDMFGGIFDTIGQTFLFVGVGVVGVFLMIIGSFMSMGSRRKNMIDGYGMGGIFTPPMNPNASNSWQNTGSVSFGNPMQTPNNPSAPQGLAQQLQQLEDAYKRNLLTREEYDKARQKLIDSMGQ